MEQSIHSDDGDLTAIVRAGFSLSTKSAVNSSSQFRIPPIFSDFTQGGISSSLQNNTTSCHFSNPNSSSGTYNISFSSSASASAAAAAAVPTSTTITTTTQHIMPNLNDVMKGPYHNMSYGGHHFMKQTYEAATRPPLSPSLSSFSFSSNPSSSSSSSSPSASIPVMKTRETKRRGAKGSGGRKGAGEKRVTVVHVPATATATATGENGLPSNPADMWSWRKYGQKPIKGSPYPRSYYRCSSSKGCPARKQVERSLTDPSMLIFSYTSEHNHAWPLSIRAPPAPPAPAPAPALPSSPSSSSSKQIHQHIPLPPLSPNLQDTKSPPSSFNTSDVSSQSNANNDDDGGDGDDDGGDGSLVSTFFHVSNGTAISPPHEQEQEQEQEQCDDFLLHDALFAEMLEDMQGGQAWWSMEMEMAMAMKEEEEEGVLGFLHHHHHHHHHHADMKEEDPFNASFDWSTISTSFNHVVQ